MFVLKTITTVLIACLGFVVVWFLDQADNKESFIGFYIMLIVYVLSIVCIWG